MKELKNGKVWLRGNNKNSAVVQKIGFNDLEPNVPVPIGAVGTMDLTSPPGQRNFAKRDILEYHFNNDITYILCVTQDRGPSRYDITVQEIIIP